MRGLRQNGTAFKSAILKRRLSHTDKSDPKNIKLPEFLENLDDEKLYSLVERVIEKYKQQNYIGLEREELDELKDFSDLHVLVLILFYKRGWRYIIDDESCFPHFVFTYNKAPLKKEVDKITTHIYDKFDPELTKDELISSFTYSVLEVTYLLHYFTISHPFYIDPDEEEEDF